MKKFSYIGISFVILIFGIIFIPRIVENIGNAYPNLDFGLLYFSCQKNTAVETNGLLDLSEFKRSAIIEVPDSETEAVFIEQSIRQLNVLPRDAVTSDK
jgi:hypothetical protein